MSEVVQTVFIVLVIVLFAIVIGCCCHITAQKRRGEIAARRRTTQQGEVQPSGYTNQSETGSIFILRLRGASSTSDSTRTGYQRSSSVAEDVCQNHDESPRSPDAIADSGPPPYIAVSNEPPPPSYEEAVRVSQENLAM